MNESFQNPILNQGITQNPLNAFPQVQPQPQPQNVLLPQFQFQQPTPSLNLTQSKGYNPPRQFVDSSNTSWTLIKSAFDSTSDVPDHKSVQLVEYWYHRVPGESAYIYVVEGVRLPRVPTEAPTRIMYQWFSKFEAQKFDVNAITESEWLMANVWAAPVLDTRQSKLNALCYVDSSTQKEEKPDDHLLQLDALNGRSNENGSEQATENN